MNLKSFIAGTCMVMSAMLSAEEQLLPGAAEYGTIPKGWELKKVCGRDFHTQFDFYLKVIKKSSPIYTSTLLPDFLVPLESQPENIRKLAAMDCFRDVQYRFILLEEEQSDGSYTVPLEKLPLKQKCIQGRPFTIDLLPRPGLPKIYYLSEIKNDQEAYRKWLGEHPEFRGFSTFEWGNDAVVLYQPQRHKGILPGSSRFAITQSDIDRLVAKYPKPMNRDEHVSGLLRRTFNRILEYSFDDPAHLSIGEGHWCIGHLAAYWGAGKIGIETTRNYAFWQNQMMFCRGAARQFNIPWSWYVASYFEGFDSKGNMTSEGSLFSENDPRLKWHGPDYGTSLSSVKRAFYMAWLAGASDVEREGVENCFFIHRSLPLEKQGLSEEGRMYVDFYRLVTSNPDRGVPYTPVALLVPANRGYCRFGGKAFTTYDYTQTDFMLDAVMSTILDYPNNRVLEKMRNGVECVMANQPYGDIFDAITPDFEKQDSFRQALPNYKAAILIGDYKRNPEMAKILVDYVKKGGTLVLNISQLNEDFPSDFAGLRPTGKIVVKDQYTIDEVKLADAKSLLSASDGTVLFAKNRYGKGSVIVGMQRWLTPWYGNDAKEQDAALGNTSLKKPIHFPEIEWLMKRLSSELLPISVEGNIQYGLNRTKDGWLLYLINNSGVIKFADKAQVLAPEGQRVRIDVTRITGKGVFELVTGKNLETSNGMLEVNVPSGNVRILKIQTPAK